MGGMTLINMLVILYLRKHVVRTLDEYQKKRKLDKRFHLMPKTSIFHKKRITGTE